METSSSTWMEAFNLLCDEVIGRGMSRVVFSSEILPDCVIKVEERRGYFQNVIEWETWERVKHTQASRWFAECKWISPNGKILVMEKTRVPSPSEFPEKMPVFLTDFKRKNFGMAMARSKEGNETKEWFVCHDYGTHLMLENGMTKKMKNVDFWNE